MRFYRKKTHEKRELNLRPNESRIDVYEILWGTIMQTIMENSLEESGEHRKFGHLPGACCNSPFQSWALTSESFSERMISEANLLVDAHHIYSGHDFIDKMIVLCMKKRLKERA